MRSVTGLETVWVLEGQSSPKPPATGSQTGCPQVNRLSAKPWLLLRRKCKV